MDQRHWRTYAKRRFVAWIRLINLVCCVQLHTLEVLGVIDEVMKWKANVCEKIKIKYSQNFYVSFYNRKAMTDNTLFTKIFSRQI